MSDTPHSTFRTRPRRLVAWTLGLWFALGLQPCAVAALTLLECPHCPEHEAHGEHPKGHTPHGDHGDSHDHSRIASDAGPDAHCETRVSDCCELGVAATDARTGQSVQDDVSDDHGNPAAASAGLVSTATVSETQSDPPDRTSPYAPQVRLHLRYCVFLD